MLNTICVGRIVRVGDLVTIPDGNGGTFNKVWFHLATDKQNRKKLEEKYPNDKYVGTDFVYCTAVGAIADLIANYCNYTNPATGKLVSRQVEVVGRFESFRSNSNQLVITGYNQDGSVASYQEYACYNVLNWRLNVDRLILLDKNPNPNTNINTLGNNNNIVVNNNVPPVVTPPVIQQPAPQPVQTQVPVTPVAPQPQVQVPPVIPQVQVPPVTPQAPVPPVTPAPQQPVGAPQVPPVTPVQPQATVPPVTPQPQAPTGMPEVSVPDINMTTEEAPF